DTGAWWHGFHDPILDRLVDTALANNLDLQAAAARIDAARAVRIGAASQWFPSVDLNAGAGFRDGLDAVALFDQDSSVPAAYFPTMRDVCAGLAGRAFLAGPRIFDENARSFLPELATNGIGLRRLHIEPGTPMQRCAFLISSGCVVSRDAFDVLGRFDE
ncbi:TolC family protein, partial [Xanthomonas citri pv. citri]